MKKSSSIYKYLLNYKANSIIIKNFLAIMLVIILPFMVLFWNTYYNTIKSMKQEVDEISKPYLLNIVNSLDNIYSEMTLLTYTLAHSSSTVSFMAENDINKLITQKIDITSITGNPTLTYKYIDSIYVYSDKNKYVLSNTYNDKIDNFTDKNWLKQYSYLEKNDMAIVPRKNNDTYPYYLTFITPVYTEPYTKIGAVVVNLDIEMLSKMLLGHDDRSSEIYVLNEYKKLVFCNKPELIYNNFDKYNFVYDRVKFAEENDGRYALYTIKSDTSKLEYISIVPQYFKGYYAFQLIFIVILMIITTLGVSFFLAVRTFKPIGSIIAAIDEPGEPGGLGITNEIQYILDNINRTVADKRVVEVELEHRMKLLNHAYSTALQSQINPHFLYNTLETINFMAYELCKGNNDISKITTSLSQMLRIGLDNESKIVPFNTELEHLKLYIQILTLRYPELCKFEFNISPEAERCNVVKLILQPIVENAFYHGIKPKMTMGIITVSAFANDKYLILKVADDGVGISPEHLRSIEEILNNEMYLSSKHIGINNVNRRIKMTFGNEYGLYVRSAQGIGTTFTMKLPKITDLANHS